MSETRQHYLAVGDCSRFPVSIMPAGSFGAAVDGEIRLLFASQAFVGFGTEVEGRFMISDMVVSHPDADHAAKEQHVLMANGTGQTWTFVRYEYTRRP